MNRILQLLACILLCVMIPTTTVCSCVPKEKEYPEHYEQFAELLGESRETVLRSLHLTEQDMILAPGGSYAIPVTAQYNRFIFDLSLDFDRADDRLCGFSYTAEWDRQADDAARNVGKLAKALTKTFGEAREDMDPDRFSHMSEDELTAAFREAVVKDEPVGADYWFIEKRKNPTILEYVAAIRERTDSGRVIADYLNWTLEMKVGVSEEFDSVGVILQFRLETEYLSN